MKALALIALLLISNTIKANSFRDDYRKIMREIRKADDVQLIIGDKVYRGKAVGTSQTFNALTLSYEVSEIKFSGVFFIVFDTAEEAMFLAHFQDSGVPNPATKWLSSLSKNTNSVKCGARVMMRFSLSLICMVLCANVLHDTLIHHNINMTFKITVQCFIYRLH